MMKSIMIILAELMIVSVLFSQSIERDVVASSGDYYETAVGSVSWTLGELATETFTSPNNILTQGFQQPTAPEAGFALDIKFYLEGPFNVSVMNTILNNNGSIPLSQPYNTGPWNYTGTEAVASMPNGDIVDWILVELRDAVNANSATSATIVETRAVFIKSDGSVVGLDGNLLPQFNLTINDQLFVVVWQRNHIGIMSAFPLPYTSGLYSYNFSTGIGQVYGGMNGHKELVSGIWGMVGADGNADEQINNLDKNDVWAVEAGSSGYFSGDFNMDNQVNNADKNDIWIPNTGLGGQVPDFTGASAKKPEMGYKCQVPD
ncbi:MAG: hypothetical protein K8R53_11320 [Bacteroidales bacterium]|nr:hypothetical protein [Bacteroidales bacterium]